MSAEPRKASVTAAARFGGWLRWLLGAVVGLAGLVVVGLMLFGCVKLVTAPPKAGLSRLDVIAIAYGLAFVSVVVGIACVRLIVPQWRTAHGGILDGWSFRVLAVIYGLILIVGAALNPGEALVRVTMVVLALLVLAALRATFGWPRRGAHGRDEEPSGADPPTD